MADSARDAGAILLLSPSSESEWDSANRLIAELQAWDLEQSRRLGFDGDEVLRVFYGEDADAVRRDSMKPDGCFLLAMDATAPAGCAAFRRQSASACELYSVFVRPACRGRSIGRTLIRRLVSDARLAGYQTMRLETALFMRDAQKLYQSLNFQTREPYRQIAPHLARATLWLELQLGHLSPKTSAQVSYRTQIERR
jgi:ribosomal protein S18 acetylase RimI-like enzyme